MRRRVDDQMVRRMYVDEGLTTIEIAERIGFSDVTVGNALTRLGVPRHPRTHWPKTSGRPRSDAEARFAAKCDRRRPQECWPWLGRKDADGYGIFWLDGKQRRAHRVAYEAVNGAIAQLLTVDHRCANAGCVNPAHMELVTLAENTRRAQARLREHRQEIA